MAKQNQKGTQIRSVVGREAVWKFAFGVYKGLLSEAKVEGRVVKIRIVK